jgi:hypothetical protein
MNGAFALGPAFEYWPRPLPEDLAGALKWLDDVEIDALLAAVTIEAELRGRRPSSPAKEKPMAKPQRPPRMERVH